MKLLHALLATGAILSAHQPASFKGAIAAGFNLQLSGHTHGGQFFPFTILVRLVQRYVRGLYRNGKLWIYVNRGTGYWGPPVRFLVPPEITLITLTYKSNVSEKKIGLILDRKIKPFNGRNR